MKKIIFGILALFLVIMAIKFFGGNYTLNSFIHVESRGILAIAGICFFFGFCLFLLRENNKSFWRTEERREARRKEMIADAIRKGEDPDQIDWYESYF